MTSSLGIPGFAFSSAWVASTLPDLLLYRLPPSFWHAPFHLACGFPSSTPLLSWAPTRMLLTLVPLSPSFLLRAARLPWGSKVICAFWFAMGIQSDLLLSLRYHCPRQPLINFTVCRALWPRYPHKSLEVISFASALL